MDPGGDSIVLEEEIDPNYEPTEQEVNEYASWLGMDLEAEKDLFWIAREGLKAPLPENWKPCKTTDTEEIYYFNFATGQSTWDHPCDEFYRNLYDEHKKKHTQGKKTPVGDEKKKKEKDDVAELLGRRGSGKKKKGSSLSKAEPLGPPTLTRGGMNLLEKKPLPGLSSSKPLGGLSVLGSTGGALRTVGGLGRLSSEAKEDDDNGDSGDEREKKRSPRALTKPPLGGLLSKKPLAAPIMSKAESKAELDSMANEFEKKKEKLMEEHADELRGLTREHDEAVATMRKKAEKKIEEMQEDEDTKLRQRKKEMDRKMIDIENKYDKDESNLLRERKEKLKRLESEMEQALTHKRQEVEKDQEKEARRLQSRHESKMQEIEDDYAREEKQLADKLKVAFTDKNEAMNEAARLRGDVEKLRGIQQNLETELTSLREKYEKLEQERNVLQEECTTIAKEVQTLTEKLTVAEDKLHQEQERAETKLPLAPVPAQTPVECSVCRGKDERIFTLETEKASEHKQLEECRATIETLENTVRMLKEEQHQRLQQPERHSETPGTSRHAVELTELRSVDAQLRQELKDTQVKEANALKMVDTWKAKHEEMQGRIQTLQEELRQKEEGLSVATTTTNANATSANRDADEQLENLRNEVLDLQDQLSALSKTNSQVKEQLLKESNEKKRLAEQLDTLASGEDDAQRELTRQCERLQHDVDEINGLLQGELASKGELNTAMEILRQENQVIEQEKRKFVTEYSTLESENRRLESEKTILERRLDEITKVQVERVAADQSSESDLTTQLSKQRWELEASHRVAVRDKEELQARVKILEAEVEDLTRSKNCLEAEKTSEIQRSKKRENEREALSRQQIRALQDDIESHTERLRAATAESSELKTQLGKLRFKEQTATDKVAQLQDELTEMENKVSGQQLEIERLGRDVRAKSNLAEEKTKECRDAQSDNEVLTDQIGEVSRQLAEARARIQAATVSAGSSDASYGSGAVELEELRARASEAESRLSILTSEKAQLTEKSRQLTQRLMESESKATALDVDRDRLADESRTLVVEVSKWKERLEKKQKEYEQLKSEYMQSQTDKDELDSLLVRERTEKKEMFAQKASLEKSIRAKETELAALTTQLEEIEAAQRNSGLESQTHQSRLKRVEAELAAVTKELRSTQEERDDLVTKARQHAQDQATLESRVRLLRHESTNQDARVKMWEDDLSRHSDTIQRLETQLEDKEAKLRALADEKQAAMKQVSMLTAEKDDMVMQLSSFKRKCESMEAKNKDSESAATRGEFQIKMRVQQLESERDTALVAKDRTEEHAKALERELHAARDELAVARSDTETARARIKALSSEKDEMQATLLGNMQANQTHQRSGATTESDSASRDAMLVRLQLADVNKTELEQHLADVAAQLELATRRCSLAEARTRDQAVEAESLHVEIASLRSGMQKMHLSALESLPLVERFEYEHKKRTLRSDFLHQLRDYQEREEQALVRQKARLRAQHERQLDEITSALDSKKQARVDQEERLVEQMVIQLRKERGIQIRELKHEMAIEMENSERELRERKEKHVSDLAALLHREEEEELTRLREARQAQREEELVRRASNRDSDHKAVREEPDARAQSPGQVRGRVGFDEGEISASDEYDSDQRAQARKMRKAKPKRMVLGKNITTTKSSRLRRRHHQQPSRRRVHAAEKEVARWRKRVADEVALLEKARALVTKQKLELKQQADKVKQEKWNWKREAERTRQDSAGSSRFQHAILQEMKGMIDQSAAHWNERKLQLDDREAWIARREKKVAEMRDAVSSLPDVGPRRRRSHERRHQPHDTRGYCSDRGASSVSPVPSSSSSLSYPRSFFGEDDDVDDKDINGESNNSQHRTDRAGGYAGLLHTLERLDDELVSDVSELSDDGFNAISAQGLRCLPLRGGGGEGAWPYHTARMDVTGPPPQMFRYPITTAFSDPIPSQYQSNAYRRASLAEAAYPLQQQGMSSSSRFQRAPSTRAASGIGAGSSLVTDHGWSSLSRPRVSTAAATAISFRGTATRRGVGHSHSHSQEQDIMQRQIARWARGREKVQHAATRQASWLSNLYQEVQEYGDSRLNATTTAPIDSQGATGGTTGMNTLIEREAYQGEEAEL